jgi:large subunit ribosomal protein L22
MRIFKHTFVSLPVRAKGPYRDRYVRGKSANEALEILRFVNKRAALPVHKLVASAVANAEENFGVSRDDLLLPRSQQTKLPPANGDAFGARGRFKPILRRSSHVTVILRERGA